MRSARPQRRQTTHVESLYGELCIYEWTTKTVHALNPAAALIWNMCDGATTIDEMTVALRREMDTAGADAIVQHALAQFAHAGLLEPATVAGVGSRVSRRALLRRIGAVAAIPVVTSIVAPTPLAAQSSRSMQFTFTGAAQFFTVPPGVTSLHVVAVGATGGTYVTPSPSPFPAGPGGRVQATLLVTPAETLTIMVGGSGTSGGFNGGGPRGPGPLGLGFAGGGASDVRRSSTLLIVAGGGGGSGYLPFLGAVGAVAGGAGGGLVGAAAADAGVAGSGGGGGTQSAGGAGGVGGPGGSAGSPGVSGTGGQGAPALFAGPPGGSGDTGGSGGGGGFFGGGGGGGLSQVVGAGGGGGSSYTDPSATNVVHTQGVNSGPGVITLSW